ncbi:MAG TPA: UDP-N-acetylglucosamine 1-carboxyvinyltransferase [Candidatus Hydrogenedens sp.]|nr:UDP-N-acetylglucosamine 1-carboxyvinyltransferase [Candidatus Hydrogenedens sp.]HOK08112.1 UDP-N-acetylglucosamine 1-carboxyvinyltransferase [Candidatus Hydrogenedens sp.]HPP57894.1 UDP-N-acetylglucosamine 1-carboxyvinyltransferase [Candidatus Hydrogenedens sp.]
MDKIIIRGNNPLKGKVQIRGAKNAVLPLMAASILAEEPCVLHNVPCLHDVFTMDKLLSQMGLQIEFTGRFMTIVTPNRISPTAPYDLVRKMRASFFVLGPLLARCGKARVSLPGGCAIGTRPVDIHLKGLEQLGAKIRLEEGYVVAEGRLKGTDIYLDFPSVGATENLIMAAVRAKGITRLFNPAQEPEIVDLANFLNKMGAEIEGAGTEVIKIKGIKSLGGTEHNVIPDRIEAGTFLIAGLATFGDVQVDSVIPEYLSTFISKLNELGADVQIGSSYIRVKSPQKPLKAINITTLPYPGFPTDLQAQMMALLTCAEGTSVIKETVFENRFLHVAELIRMGADITLEGNTAIIRGTEKLIGAPVMASDLRASAALVIAGLMAKEGETIISRVYHLDRGYERIEERLASLGADIQRIHEE